MTKPRHFLIDDDLAPSEVVVILDYAQRLKRDRLAARPLAGPRSVAVLFEKQSTRTRVSFEVGIAELGGHPLIIDARTSQLGRGEPIEDTGQVLSRYVSAIVLRTFGHDRIEALAASSSVPVINALSDLAHPCQWLADLMTIREHRGEPAGQTITYVGDGNNVAHSILLGGTLAGMHVRVASPSGYEPLPAIVDACAGDCGAYRWQRAGDARCCRGRRLGPTSCTPMFGRRWARRASPPHAARCSRRTRSMTVSSR